MFCSGDDIGAIVADVGSYTSRIGFAGDDMPRSFSSSYVGSKPLGESVSYSYDLLYEDGLAVNETVSNGLITNWELFEKLWDHALSESLKVDAKENPVLFSEKPYNPLSNREKIVELLFEKYSCPAAFIAKDAVLSCYACGRTSGLVVDCGASGTVLTPVVDGWVEAKGLSKSVIGGQLMDAFGYDSLLKKAPEGRLYPRYQIQKSVGMDGSIVVNVDRKEGRVHPTYEQFMKLDIGREFKECVSKMADDTVNEKDPRFTNVPSVPYELPDGTVVDVGIERFWIPELLVRPVSEEFIANMQNVLKTSLNITGQEYGCQSVPKLITESIIRCDADVQLNLLSNIVVTGGASSFEGTPDRIRSEVESIVHESAPTLKVKTSSCNSNERVLCTWLGGSILASLGSFHEMWISGKEYSEFGAGIVHRKCP